MAGLARTLGLTRPVNGIRTQRHLLPHTTKVIVKRLTTPGDLQLSDWDFLHDMHAAGYSPAQISDAAACGYNPWEWQPDDEADLRAQRSQPNPELVEILESLVDAAMSYHELTGRYLQIWGELGELYAEIAYGIRRHKPKTPGSDGKIGNDYVEIKTISPEKNSTEVQVKRAGNFNKLLIVKISDEFRFETRMLDRKAIPKGEGTHARVDWASVPVGFQSAR